MITRKIFELFLEEHPDAKNKIFHFEDSYPEMECLIEWYEDKLGKLKKEMRHSNGFVGEKEAKNFRKIINDIFYKGVNKHYN